jgi:L-ascorbate metabolism protein UlaG (beta-lactamase superfamily)
MKLVKFTHACVRLEHDGRVLVIDPGVWSEPSALRGADAVLVTHEHADHLDHLRLRGLGVPVYAPATMFVRDLEIHRLTAGEEFTAAGFAVKAFGGKHATIYGDEPDCANLGYLVEGDVYHPGDSLHVPDDAVRTLLAPLQGSWMRTSESIDFVKTVAPERVFGIHDAQLNERGLDSVNHWLGSATGHDYRYLRPGESA